MKKVLSFLPTQSLILFLLCGAGIIAFVFLIILPTQNTSAQLDKEILKISDRIEEQRILKPVFESLLKRAKKKNPTDLPATKTAKLDRSDISKLSEDLQEMAFRNGLIFAVFWLIWVPSLRWRSSRKFRFGPLKDPENLKSRCGWRRNESIWNL
jgi:hypothetical protein